MSPALTSFGPPVATSLSAPVLSDHERRRAAFEQSFQGASGVVGGSLLGHGYGLAIRTLVGPRFLPRLPIAELTPRIPPTPLLEAAERPERNMHYLGRWYTQACQVAFNEAPWTFRRVVASRTKYAGLLHRAAATFIELGIQPASWIEWSIAVWERFGKVDPNAPPEKATKPRRTTKPWPPVDWVFSEKRIRDRLNWYRSELPASALGEKSADVPGLKEFLDARAIFAADFAVAPPNVTVEELSKNYFGDETMEDAFDRVRRAAIRARELLELDIQNGKWVW